MKKFETGLYYPIKLEELPFEWTYGYVGDFVRECHPGFASGKHNQEGKGIPHLRPMNIDREGNLDLSVIKFVAPEKDRKRLHAGDVLFNNTNSPELIGKTTLIKLEGDFAFSNHMTRLVFLDEVDPQFAAYQLHYLWMRGYYLHSCVKHVNQASISTKKLSDAVPFVIAPLQQQKRIVEEIEKQFSRLDEAVENLQRVKANLKRYKAAVLKAAVEGKLTEEWRKHNPDVEPASKLLERILTERRTKWEEAELTKMKAKGKVPKDDKWKKKYKEPVSPGKVSFSIPSYWCTATVMQLSKKVQYGTSSKTNDDDRGIPILRMGNIFGGNLIFDNLKYLPTSHKEFPELLLKNNDLLFNRTNSAELVGKTAIYKGKPSPCSFASYLIKVQFYPNIESLYISSFINSFYGRRWIGSVVSQQVGQANVNGTKLQNLTIPLPPFEEQQEIARNMEETFSLIENLEHKVEVGLVHTNRLRQSILKKAFSGKLFKPGSNDEPASLLLQRIKEKKTTVKTNRSKRSNG